MSTTSRDRSIAPAAARAPVLEVFRSIQGEGAFAGEPQLLLRLAGCPLRCRWCDTPHSWPLPPDGRGRGTDADAPAAGARLDAREAAQRLDALDPAGRLAVSVTGGEPLLWPEFVLALRSAIGSRRLHLETAGAHPRALGRVAGVLDHLSLDLKLPADLAPPAEIPPLGEGGAPREPVPRDAREWRAVRRASLEVASRLPACLKVPVAGGREPAEFEELLADAAQLAPGLPLVLQPITPRAGVGAPAPEVLLALAERALELGLRPRVVPQLHPLLGLP